MWLAVAAHWYLLLERLDDLGMNLSPPQIGVGHEPAGQDRVDCYAVRRPISRDGARELHHRRLARLIMPPGDLPPGDQRVDRRDIDHPPALAARHHCPADELRAEERARQVQIH